METGSTIESSSTQGGGVTAREGRITKTVEAYTAKVPSIAYLGLALGSMALSASLAAVGNRKTMANFVGLWVPTLMLVGIYNKLVKLEGSDRFDRQTLH